MALPVANGKCYVCNRDPVKVRHHPSYAVGGVLENLGSKLACLDCLGRLKTEWPLDEDGNHQWCNICACETNKVKKMVEQLCVTKDERMILDANKQLDKEGAALYVCDGACPVALCAACLLRHFGVKALLNAAEQGHWECPICTEPAPPVPAPPAPAPAPPAEAPPAEAPPTEPAFKKARVDEPTLAEGTGLFSSSSSSDSDDGAAA